MNDELNRQDKQASHTVHICFRDRSITAIFSELLQARGIATHIVPEAEKLPRSGRIITEPHIFEDLPLSDSVQFLIVGGTLSEQTPHSTHLSQPLTERKVERALEQFLT